MGIRSVLQILTGVLFGTNVTLGGNYATTSTAGVYYLLVIFTATAL